MSTEASRTADDDLLPAERGHLDALDGLRAVAAFVVVVFHVASMTADVSEQAGPWRVVAHGDVGVPIFFALSGLLLFRPWVRRTLTDAASPDVRAYLWRRALRVLPAYWVVAIVALFAFNRAKIGSAWTWTEWLGLLQIYDFGLGGTGPHGLGQMWSLATEVMFYLLLPLIAGGLTWFAARGVDVNTRAKRLLYGLGALTIIPFIWVAAIHGSDHQFSYELWLPRWIGYFAVGMALSVVAVWARVEPGHPDGPVGRFARTVAFMPGACWLLAAAAWGLVATPLSGPPWPGSPSLLQSEAKTVLYIVITVGLLAPAAFQPARETLTSAVLGNPLMRFLGRISYGVFLWQFVVIYAWYELTGRPIWGHDFVLVLTVVLVGTIAAATASYYLIEKPAQRLKDWVSVDAARWQVTLPEVPEVAPPEVAPGTGSEAIEAATAPALPAGADDEPGQPPTWPPPARY